VQACKLKKNDISIFNFSTAYHWVFLLVNIGVYWNVVVWYYCGC
jgi:hypothetical protein